MNRRRVFPTILLTFAMLFMAFVASYLMLVFISSMIIPTTKYDVTLTDRFAVIYSALISLALTVIIAFNKIKDRREAVEVCKANIRAFKENADNIYNRINTALTRLMRHEEEVFSATAEKVVYEMPQNVHIVKASQLKSMMNTYPKLNSQQAVNVLLKDCEECEQALKNAYIGYNRCIEEYNFAVQTFPGVLAAWFTNSGLIKPQSLEEEFTDDELGL